MSGDLQHRVRELVTEPRHIAELVDDVIAEDGEALRVLARAMGIVIAASQRTDATEQMLAVERANNGAAQVIFAAAINRAARELARRALH